MTEQSTEISIIGLTPENIGLYGVCGYKDAIKHPELKRKIDWFKAYYPKGLRIKALITPEGTCQGMLEYIPGEYAHRPVNADGFMFIHCIFSGFKKEFKGKGYASMMIDECISESLEQKKQGVAVVTRKGSFMAGKDIFVKKGFVKVDEAKPDFELLALKFHQAAENPSFRKVNPENYPEGLIIQRSPQCPYSGKNVNEIMDSARKMNLQTTLMELNDHGSASHSPCAFGTFCILYDGKIISHHPVSRARFENIMRTIL